MDKYRSFQLLDDASNGQSNVTMESLETRSMANAESILSQFQRSAQETTPSSYYIRPQEPRVGATAPTASEIDMMSFRRSSMDTLLDDAGSNHNLYMGSSRAESMASNMWSDTPATGTSPGGGSANRNYNEIMNTFDFLVKSLTSAHNYVSILTREQLWVLRSLKPSLLYELLQEVAKLHSEKRLMRALPNECAFCKNNGENEEYYSKHQLKDWCGRVTCPVLRDFRCPRCGATGDNAHTIKYCPENPESAYRRGSGLASRRRVPPPSSLNLGRAAGASFMPPPGLHTPQPAGAAPPAPSPQPATAPLTHSSSLWSTFGIN